MKSKSEINSLWSKSSIILINPNSIINTPSIRLKILKSSLTRFNAISPQQIAKAESFRSKILALTLCYLKYVENKQATQVVHSTFQSLENLMLDSGLYISRVNVSSILWELRCDIKVAHSWPDTALIQEPSPPLSVVNNSSAYIFVLIIRYFICPSEYGLKVNYSELHITQLHLIHSLVSPFPAELIDRIQGRNALPLSYMVCLLSFLLTTVLITLLLISGYLWDHWSLHSFFSSCLQ